jgi:cyanophycinase
MNRIRLLFFLAALFFGIACGEQLLPESADRQEPTGKLFIIGGGKRPPEMIKTLLKSSSFSEQDHIAILPMASGEPDSSAYYAGLQFIEQGVKPDQIKSFFFTKEHAPEFWMDSLRTARIIYITGGDQGRFMEVVAGGPIEDAIRSAYQAGATIAGTSAGAAVMSRQMITGNEFKHPEYTGDFRTIEAENLEIKPGLGLLPDAIIDQHFIYRMRMNRLITASLEQPDAVCIGIDESTAILVEGDSAQVVGEWQVIVLRNPHSTVRKSEGLLGGNHLDLSVFLPGDRFALR